MLFARAVVLCMHNSVLITIIITTAFLLPHRHRTQAQGLSQP